MEVTNVQGTLYCSGQTAISADGTSSNADMETQLKGAIDNLEQLINQAGYKSQNIVRLNVYHTDTEGFFKAFPILQNWIIANNIKQATTVMEVKTLFETLTVELEALVVR